MLADPIILIPGITASYLRDDYPLPPEIVWSVLRKKYDRTVLHPNDLRYEAREPAAIRPDQLFEIAYKELIEELRTELSPRGAGDNEGVPIYPFAYDWRKQLSELVDALGDFVDEVIDRTKLQKHYHAEGYSGKINLIGHSMGGLIIAGYLARRRSHVEKINRVATLATPFQGSYESVLKITTGLGILDVDPPKARDRHAARLTPSLYHLLPSFEDALDSPDTYPNSFFDHRAWQPSVEKTLARFISETAVRPVRPRTLFKRMLRSAHDYLQKSVHDLNLQEIGFDPDRWLCVVGVNSKTHVKLSATEVNGVLRYELTSKNRLDLWDAPKSGSRDRGLSKPERMMQTGDGTVPYRGSIPPFLDRSKLVCVTPSDYGTWELKDRTLTKIGGFHGILPNMNMLHRMLKTFFKPFGDDRKPEAPDHIWGRPAPDLPERETAWNPPFHNLRPKKD